MSITNYVFAPCITGFVSKLLMQNFLVNQSGLIHGLVPYTRNQELMKRVANIATCFLYAKKAHI
jgi:hypothetical protein